MKRLYLFAITSVLGLSACNKANTHAATTPTTPPAKNSSIQLEASGSDANLSDPYSLVALCAWAEKNQVLFSDANSSIKVTRAECTPGQEIIALVFSEDDIPPLGLKKEVIVLIKHGLIHVTPSYRPHGDSSVSGTLYGAYPEISIIDSAVSIHFPADGYVTNQDSGRHIESEVSIVLSAQAGSINFKNLDPNRESWGAHVLFPEDFSITLPHAP